MTYEEKVANLKWDETGNDVTLDGAVLWSLIVTNRAMQIIKSSKLLADDVLNDILKQAEEHTAKELIEDNNEG